MQPCFVALQLTEHAQLDPGWVSAPAAAHMCRGSCAIRLLRGQDLGDVVKCIWLNAASYWQFSVQKESVTGFHYFCSFILHPATDLYFVLCYCPP